MHDTARALTAEAGYCGGNKGRAHRHRRGIARSAKREAKPTGSYAASSEDLHNAWFASRGKEEREREDRGYENRTHVGFEPE